MTACASHGWNVSGRPWRRTRCPLLPDYWGELCVTPECASRWADRFIGTVRLAWNPNPEMRSYFKGTTACLSALFGAGRYDQILQLLDLAPYKMWSYQLWGVKALAAQGRRAEAIRYAKDSGGLNDSPVAIAQACEEILLDSGLAEEAYNRYAIMANQKTTNLATFRAIAQKYPQWRVRRGPALIAARLTGARTIWLNDGSESFVFLCFFVAAYRPLEVKQHAQIPDYPGADLRKS